MSTYRPEFVAALSLLAEAFDEVVAAGFERPIIVGGAALEFYTGGAVASGDFDVLTAAQIEPEAALQHKGFRRPNQPGTLTRGLYHPELGIGFEVVSGHLFDGAADRTRTRIVSVPPGAVRFPAVEDMIADRMGQFAAPDRGDMACWGKLSFFTGLPAQILRSRWTKHTLMPGSNRRRAAATIFSFWSRRRMKPVTLEDQARVIEAWKRRNGISGRDYVPSNSGLHRTASKRRLLRAIVEDAQKHGRTAAFRAKY